MGFTIDAMQKRDWREVRDIYAEGLATGIAAFRSKPPAWKEWDAGYLPHSRFVARGTQSVLGWAALAAVSSN